MGVITKDTFDPIRAFCNVRLQQGVPIVDADINELDDIRKFEVRAFLKWFVGDGVPDGNDGFRVDALGATDDFQIGVGAQSTAPAPNTVDSALKKFGRCIVDGLDVIIQSPTTYKDQLLSSADVAKALGVPQLSSIPTDPGPVLVYLDVWERLINPGDVDGRDLIVPLLVIETCARTKREWVVRTRAGATVPVQGDGTKDFQEGHSYYGLALINRRTTGAGVAPIVRGDITDQRERGLSIPPSTLVADLIGGSASEYQRGMNRPAVSLRNAINALIRGDSLGSAPQQIQSISEPHEDWPSYGITFDQAGGLNVVWIARTEGPNSTRMNQVVGARLDPTNPELGLTGLTSIADVASSNASPHSVVLPTGDILVVYVTPTSDAITFKRALDLSSLSTASPQTVVKAAGVSAPYAVVVPVPTGGGYVVFFWYATDSKGVASLKFNRRLYDSTWAEGSASFADGAGRSLSSNPVAGPGGGFHAAAGPDGNVWAAFETTAIPSNLQVVQLTVASGVLFVPRDVIQGGSAPFIVIRSTPDNASPVAWVFCRTRGVAGAGINYELYTSGSGDHSGQPLLVPGQGWAAQGLMAALDHRGGIWVFWNEREQQIVSTRWSPTTNAWGPVRAVPTAVSAASSTWVSFVISDPKGVNWLFSASNSETPFVNRMYFQRIITEI